MFRSSKQKPPSPDDNMEVHFVRVHKTIGERDKSVSRSDFPKPQTSVGTLPDESAGQLNPSTSRNNNARRSSLETMNTPGTSFRAMNVPSSPLLRHKYSNPSYGKMAFGSSSYGKLNDSYHLPQRMANSSSSFGGISSPLAQESNDAITSYYKSESALGPVGQRDKMNFKFGHGLKSDFVVEVEDEDEIESEQSYSNKSNMYNQVSMDSLKDYASYSTDEYYCEAEPGMSQGRLSSAQVTSTLSQGDLSRANQPQTQLMAPMGTPNGVPLNQRVFLQRDYSEGLVIRFKKDFPPEFNGRIDQMTFEATMARINDTFAEAERLDCSTFCESCLGFLTAGIILWCRDSRYEKAIKRISKYVEEQNRCVYLPKGLYITDPIERGLRCIEITILAEQQHS